MSDTQLILDTEQAGLSIPERPSAPLRSGANDLRHAMMSLPIEQQETMLAEFKERRDNLRDWLLKQMKMGLHYGTPPGCEEKVDRNGNPIVNPEQWLHKPTLYAAGADLIAELFGLIDTYEPDMLSWEQLGKPTMCYVRKCELFSRATGEKVGEGTGARKTSENKGSVNDALKMADKSAKIAAVLNAYGLRDLFTQPMELPQAEQNPNKNGNAPTVAPRADRGVDNKTAHAIIVALKTRWDACSHDPANQTWVEFCEAATHETFDYRKSGEWARGVRLGSLQSAIEKLEGGVPPITGDLPF